MRYSSCEKVFTSIRSGLKCMLCPHCKRQGTLILHGYLYGYDDTKRVKRGRRIFCNNRKMAKGCGKTFSFLLADWIRSFSIFAKWLTAYLEKIKEGHTPHSAAKATNSKMHVSSIYRIHQRFIDNQSRIRALLCRVKPPPLIDTESPVIATTLHLTSLFPDHCVTKFQLFCITPKPIQLLV